MSDAGFPKQLRLLKAAEFKAVFGHATFKVSCPYLVIFAQANGRDCGRVGLVIGKKHVPTAVQRNRIKRVLRNTFRLNQKLLHGLDIVILARSGLGSIDNVQLADRVQRLWQDLARKRDTATQAGIGQNAQQG